MKRDELFERCMALNPEEKVIIFMRLFGWMEKRNDDEFFSALEQLLNLFKGGKK